MNFEDYLSSLSDDDYFFIAETYLGKIDEPFHKPKINEKLLSFFSSLETKDAIIKMLDDKERILLSSVYLSGSLSEKEILKLAIYTPGDTIRAIMSLRDRVVLINDKDQYFVNPIFDASTFLSLYPLLGEKSYEKKTALLFNKEIIKGMISYFHTKGVSTSAIHTERTKNSDIFASVFPRFNKEDVTYLSSIILSSCVNLSVLENDAKHYYVNKENLLYFISQSTEKIYSYLFSNNDKDSYQSNYTFFTLLKKVEKMSSNDAENIINSLNVISKTKNTITLNELIKLGLFIKNDEFYYLNNAYLCEEEKKDTLILDTDFSVSYVDKRDDDDILYLFSTPVSLDYSTQYKIEKESVKAAFEIGINDSEIISYLEKNTNSSLSKIISERIKDWKRQYDMAKVYDGIIISTDEKNAEIIKNLPLMQPHIISIITDTVFLLSRRNEDQWRKILLYSGLDMLSRTKRETGLILSYKEEKEVFSFETEQNNIELPDYAEKCEYSNKELKFFILGTINNKDSQSYYLDLLYNKLLISKSQIIDGVSKRIPAASGFDFQGKIALLSQIKGNRKSLCEIETKDGKFLATVISVSSKNEDSVVTLNIIPEDKVTTILVSKIFSLKIIRGSFIR